MLSLDQLKETAKVRLFGYTQIPLIWWVKPIVLNLSVERTELKIALTRRTRNHLKSMYFGTLAIGADLAGGLLCIKLLQDAGVRASFVFKDMEAKFLKRADGDVHFVCTSGKAVQELVQKVVSSQDRYDCPVEIQALVPSKYGTEPVATFRLTLSVKKLKK